MKLLITIVQDTDEAILTDHLIEDGFRVTKLATAGGFLKKGNATLFIGVEEEKLDDCLQIIEQNCKKRKSTTTFVNPSIEGGVIQSLPVEITVGGATVFVIDVDQFIRL